MEKKHLYAEKMVSKNDLDIGVYFCGKRIKTMNHVYGPEIRPYFLVVLVSEGEAELLGEHDSIKKIKKGDLLVMFPNERVHYRSHGEWSIVWVGIDGNCLEDIFSKVGITRQSPTLNLKNAELFAAIMHKIYEICGTDELASEFKCRSLISTFFAELLSEKNVGNDGILRAARLMDYNFSEDISMDFLAKKANMDKAAFSRKFRKTYGVPPKEYLTLLRINKAKEMLRTTNFEIKEIAASVGYRDQLYFSRLFSKKEGLSPSEFRLSGSSEHLFKELSSV